MSTTTRIKKPEPLVLTGNVAGPPVLFTFEQAVLFWLNNDQRYNSDARGIKSSIRVEFALFKDPAFVDLQTETDYQLLREVIESPQCAGGVAYPIMPARRLEPFLQAIREGLPPSDSDVAAKE